MVPSERPEPGFFVKRSNADGTDLRDEAARLEAVAGPGIVPIVGLVDRADGVELRLARAESSVADAIAERGRCAESEARTVGELTLLALSRVHRAGLVHADVKPANLLLTGDGRLWLGDLGSARPLDGSPVPTGSPARRLRAATATIETDVVATAVAVVEMVTGVVADPSRHWTESDLIRIGCPPDLATDVSPTLTGSPPAAADLAEILAPAGPRRLPAPAATHRLADPTPTREFEPVTRGRASVTTVTPAGSPSVLPLVLATIVLVVVAAGIVVF